MPHSTLLSLLFQATGAFPHAQAHAHAPFPTYPSFALASVHRSLFPPSLPVPRSFLPRRQAHALALAVPSLAVLYSQWQVQASPTLFINLKYDHPVPPSLLLFPSSPLSTLSIYYSLPLNTTTTVQPTHPLYFWTLLSAKYYRITPKLASLVQHTLPRPPLSLFILHALSSHACRRLYLSYLQPSCAKASSSDVVYFTHIILARTGFLATTLLHTDERIWPCRSQG